MALSDFAIFRLVAQYWGCGVRFARWTSPEAVFQILKELSRGQPCDFSGIRYYAHIEAEGGIQWPLPEMRNSDCGLRIPERGANHENASGLPAHSALHTPHSAIPRQRRLFADGKFFTSDGRARILFDPPRPMPEPPNADYPFLLLTGRGSSAQWHTGSRTDKSAVLRKLAPAVLTAELNPADAARLRLASGDPVTVRSRRGAAKAIAWVTPTVAAGQIFLPMHFPAVNALTYAAFDPHSRQPAYKSCAVRVEAG